MSEWKEGFVDLVLCGQRKMGEVSKGTFGVEGG